MRVIGRAHTGRTAHRYLASIRTGDEDLLTPTDIPMASRVTLDHPERDRSYLFTMHHKQVDMPWVDPKEPVHNYHKHKLSCDKGRKRRKRKSN
jgi:hypothetical protein